MRILTYSKYAFYIFILFHVLIIGASKDPVRAKNGMVVSASDIASKVGIEILKKGGNAVDAAVAVGFTLAVTHPSAGNIGGGGFMVIHLADSLNTTIDFREKAPLAAYKDMYLNEKGEYLPELSRNGWSSSGVPGSVAGLIYALEKYGTMPLSQVIQPAIIYAEFGFPLQYRLIQSINSHIDDFNKYESSKKIFTKNGGPFSEGDLFIQKDLAATLKLIRDHGREGFYSSKNAELMVEQSHKWGGYLSLQDLSEYRAVERKPLIGEYLDYKIMSMGLPSSGGVAIIQALNIFENFSFNRQEWGSSKYIHTLVEIFKYLYADRSKFLGDSDFYPVPLEWITSKEYAARLSKKITETALPSNEIYAGDNSPRESEETTHYSIVDAFGNAVSTTVTINSSYGNKIVVEGAGFLMNNEMDDFSALTGIPNQFGLVGSEANSIQPGKRMLSSMTPTIIFKNGNPYLIAGSPGGSTIITAVLQIILNSINFSMNIQEAVNMPRIHHQWLPDSIDYEEFGLSDDVIHNLIQRGHNMGKIRVLGRVQAILIDHKNKTLWGASDPRGFGKAVGY